MDILKTMKTFTATLDMLSDSGALSDEDIVTLELIEAELYNYIYNTERELKERE